jgi:hypothetical protein
MMKSQTKSSEILLSLYDGAYYHLILDHESNIYELKLMFIRPTQVPFLPFSSKMLTLNSQNNMQRNKSNPLTTSPIELRFIGYCHNIGSQLIILDSNPTMNTIEGSACTSELYGCATIVCMIISQNFFQFEVL